MKICSGDKGILNISDRIQLFKVQILNSHSTPQESIQESVKKTFAIPSIHFSNLSLTISNDQLSKTYPDNLLVFNFLTDTNFFPLPQLWDSILFSAI